MINLFLMNEPTNMFVLLFISVVVCTQITDLSHVASFGLLYVCVFVCKSMCKEGVPEN